MPLQIPAFHYLMTICKCCMKLRYIFRQQQYKGQNMKEREKRERERERVWLKIRTRNRELNRVDNLNSSPIKGTAHLHFSPSSGNLVPVYGSSFHLTI